MCAPSGRGGSRAERRTDAQARLACEEEDSGKNAPRRGSCGHGGKAACSASLRPSVTAPLLGADRCCRDEGLVPRFAGCSPRLRRVEQGTASSFRLSFHDRGSPAAL